MMRTVCTKLIIHFFFFFFVNELLKFYNTRFCSFYILQRIFRIFVFNLFFRLPKLKHDVSDLYDQTANFIHLNVIS